MPPWAIGPRRRAWPRPACLFVPGAWPGPLACSSQCSVLDSKLGRAGLGRAVTWPLFLLGAGAVAEFGTAEHGQKWALAGGPWPSVGAAPPALGLGGRDDPAGCPRPRAERSYGQWGACPGKEPAWTPAPEAGPVPCRAPRRTVCWCSWWRRPDAGVGWSRSGLDGLASGGTAGCFSRGHPRDDRVAWAGNGQGAEGSGLAFGGRGPRWGCARFSSGVIERALD